LLIDVRDILLCEAAGVKGDRYEDAACMVGLAIIALRKAGLPSSDPRIQRGVQWLLSNQRASGRWWTRSLNRDGWQFISYSGTAYPMLALALCNALSKA
jgi:squalene-hopene/tetraprenyl-beta-curcumene cyclase